MFKPVVQVQDDSDYYHEGSLNSVGNPTAISRDSSNLHGSSYGSGYSSIFRYYEHAHESLSGHSNVGEDKTIGLPQRDELIEEHDASSESEASLMVDYHFPSKDPTTERSPRSIALTRRRAITDPVLVRPRPPNLPAATASDDALANPSDTFLGVNHKASLRRKAKTAVAAPYRKLSDFSERGSDAVQKLVGPLLSRRPAMKLKPGLNTPLETEDAGKEFMGAL